MARKKKEPNQESPEPKASEKVEFGRALSSYKRRNAEKAHLMMDKEVMLLFSKKTYAIFRSLPS